jgi:hypothetical protein
MGAEAGGEGGGRGVSGGQRLQQNKPLNNEFRE